MPIKDRDRDVLEKENGVLRKGKSVLGCEKIKFVRIKFEFYNRTYRVLLLQDA